MNVGLGGTPDARDANVQSAVYAIAETKEPYQTHKYEPLCPGYTEAANAQQTPHTNVEVGHHLPAHCVEKKALHFQEAQGLIVAQRAHTSCSPYHRVTGRSPSPSAESISPNLESRSHPFNSITLTRLAHQQRSCER